jgi:methyltransferase family protein
VSELLTPAYFEAFKDSSLASARVVVPIVKSWIDPGSVIDMGCGLGTWLSVWQEEGCEVRGVDGDWVDRAQLSIPADRFTAHDLSEPYLPDRRYDLAMSLEMADQLAPAAAAPFVQALTEAAPVVLFSASAPDQPGTNHINCQWPAYWAKLFAERGYDVIDTLRYIVWEDERVDWWYRQNIMLYVARDLVGNWPKLEAMHREGTQPLRLVHPELMKVWLDWGMDQSRQYWELRAQVERRPPPS